MCTCANGVAATGERCLSQGSEICTKCTDETFRLSEDRACLAVEETSGTSIFIVLFVILGISAVGALVAWMMTQKKGATKAAGATSEKDFVEEVDVETANPLATSPDDPSELDDTEAET